MIKVKIDTQINPLTSYNKIKDPQFWTFVGTEAFRLMYDYIPFLTGATASTTDIKVSPGTQLADQVIFGMAKQNINASGMTATIDFNAPQANSNYWQNKNFRKDYHKKATCKWDEAAFGANMNGPEGAKLISYMQKYVDSGRLNLGK